MPRRNQTMTDTSATGEAPGLAAEIRSRTQDAHVAAESSPFVTDLVKGRLSVVDYARLTAQHHAIYAALEEGFATVTDPTLSEFMIDGLARVPSLESDLAFLAGDDWATKLPILPATQAYADHIRRLAGEWPRGLLAHHYTRYMGDLSGGQLIRRVVRRVYHFEDERGSEFYEFPEIESAKDFKNRYREMLDGLGWEDAERERLIREASLAFSHHQAIFEQLAGAPSSAELTSA